MCSNQVLFDVYFDFVLDSGRWVFWLVHDIYRFAVMRMLESSAVTCCRARERASLGIGNRAEPAEAEFHRSAYSIVLCGFQFQLEQIIVYGANPSGTEKNGSLQIDAEAASN